MKLLTRYIGMFFILCSATICQAQMHDLHKNLPCLEKTFQVHVHMTVNTGGIIPLSPDSLQNILEETNKFFEPICARFEICDIDTIENYNFNRFDAYGSEQTEMINRYQVKNRINLYIVRGIILTCHVAGRQSIERPNRAYAAVACHTPEEYAAALGRLLGLRYTFAGNRTELVDGSNSATTGDFIQDTPADPFIRGDSLELYVQDCEFILEDLDPNGQYYQPLVGNMMSNYPCRCGFTYEQYLIMANNYLNSEIKLW